MSADGKDSRSCANQRHSGRSPAQSERWGAGKERHSEGRVEPSTQAHIPGPLNDGIFRVRLLVRHVDVLKNFSIYR